MQDFPVCKDHKKVCCFVCKTVLSGEKVNDLYAPGDGRYRQKCKKCELFTYYDISCEVLKAAV